MLKKILGKVKKNPFSAILSLATIALCIVGGLQFATLSKQTDISETAIRPWLQAAIKGDISVEGDSIEVENRQTSFTKIKAGDALFTNIGTIPARIDKLMYTWSVAGKDYTTEICDRMVIFPETTGPPIEIKGDFKGFPKIHTFNCTVEVYYSNPAFESRETYRTRILVIAAEDKPLRFEYLDLT